MKNMSNQEQLKKLNQFVIKEDKKGKLDEQIKQMSDIYKLDPVKDRDEILKFIAGAINYLLNDGYKS